MTGLFEFFLVGLAAIAAGVVNALAGGGTLITFPLLLALGIPAVAANVTNTVALCPGYLGGMLAQAKDLKGQNGRLLMFLPAGVIGGIAGGILLLNSGERLFRTLVPFLILLASGLLALQDPLRDWIIRRAGHRGLTAISVKWAVLPIGFAAIYGGYFGAGLSMIVLAVLGLTMEDSLTRLNVLKQAIAFSANIAAAIFFLFSGQVVWPVALVMAVGTLIGGALGGRIAGLVKPATLRWIVVVIGFVVAIIFILK